MPTWDYKVVRILNDSPELDQELNNLGKEEWEMAGCGTTGTTFDTSQIFLLFFKRQVPELELPEDTPETFKKVEGMPDPPPPTTKPLKAWQSPIIVEDLELTTGNTVLDEQNNSWLECRCNCHNNPNVRHYGSCCETCPICLTHITYGMQAHLHSHELPPPTDRQIDQLAKSLADNCKNRDDDSRHPTDFGGFY